MSLKRFWNGGPTYKEHLAGLLKQSRTRPHGPRDGKQPDSVYGAASLLAKILFASQRTYYLDRHWAEAVLSGIGSPVSLDHLIDRALVQFPLGTISIPAGIRMASFVPSAYGPRVNAASPPSGDDGTQPKEEAISPGKPGSLLAALSTDECIALRALVLATRQNGELSHWISQIELHRIYSVHKAAHADTPDLNAILPPTILEKYSMGVEEGYRFSPRVLGGESTWTPFVERALALLWVSLLRDEHIHGLETLFRIWWESAAGLSWSNPASQMEGHPKTAFLDTCLSLILAEAGAWGAEREVERLGWEFTLDEFSSQRFPAAPQGEAHLLDWYRWYRRPHFLEFAFGPIQTKVDVLVRFVVANETQYSPTRTLQLLSAAEQSPRLLNPVVDLLLHSARPLISAVIGNPGTSALGMRMILDLSVDESAVSQWDGGASRDREREMVRTRLWEGALQVFFSTVTVPIRGPEATGATDLSRVLLMASRRSVKGTSHAPDSAAKGAEERWQILLEFLEDLEPFELKSITDAVTEDFADVAAIKERYSLRFPALPLPELRILFWIMATVVKAAGKATPASVKIAESIVDLYTSEFRRDTANGQVVHWLDDSPDALLLPWSELCAVLQVGGSLASLIDPTALLWEDRFNGVPATAGRLMAAGRPDEARQLHQSWLRKLRLHLRILISIHRDLAAGVEPLSLLSTQDKNRLLEDVRGRVHSLTVRFAPQDSKNGRPSLFDPDFDAVHLMGLHRAPPQEPLFDTLIKLIGNFPPKERDEAFQEWIEVEDDLRIVLAFSASRLSPKVSEAVEQRLESLSLDEFVNGAGWIPELMQLAEKASITGRIDWVERILKKGSEALVGRTLPEWEKFAFRMRLIISAHKEDKDAVLNEAVPPSIAGSPVSSHPDFAELKDSRNFYHAAALRKSDPGQAYSIFKSLADKDPDNSSYAINAFAMRVEAAHRKKPAKESREALVQAWNEFAGARSKTPSSALDSPLHRRNRLLCLDAAELDELFDVDWAHLSQEQKKQIDFVSIGVANAKRRKQPEKARQLMESAKLHNLTGDGSASSEFRDLERQHTELLETELLLTPHPFDHKIARSRFLEWISGPSQRLPGIFGGDGQQLGAFLWGHLLDAAREFLSRPAIFRNLTLENHRNDAIASLMGRSLSFCGWTVPDQTRAGLSPSGKDAGERDWVVKDRHGELAIFEALNLDSVASDYINIHLNKVALDYDPERKQESFIVVYYDGNRFGEFWERYVDHVMVTPLGEGDPPIDRSDPLADMPLGNVRAALFEYESEGFKRFVWHLALNLGLSDEGKTDRGDSAA